MQTRGRHLRVFFKAMGICSIVAGIIYAGTWIIAIANGDVDPGWGLTFVFLELCVTCGGGFMMLVFDPHKLMQGNIFSLSRLVEPKRARQSFAERIHADENDEVETERSD